MAAGSVRGRAPATQFRAAVTTCLSEAVMGGSHGRVPWEGPMGGSQTSRIQRVARRRFWSMQRRQRLRGSGEHHRDLARVELLGTHGPGLAPEVDADSASFEYVDALHVHDDPG